MPKNLSIGVVTSDKMAKTRRVEIPRLVRHPSTARSCAARRSVTSTTRPKKSHIGDTVEIRESRPRCKTKRWELVRVITKSRLVDIAAMRAAAREED